MVNDLVSDMLTRIRNASLAKHSRTSVRYSKLNLAILKVLVAEGYIENYEIVLVRSSILQILVQLKTILTALRLQLAPHR